MTAPTVALVSPWWGHGGAERWLTELAALPWATAGLRYAGLGIVRPGDDPAAVAEVAAHGPVVRGAAAVRALARAADVVVTWWLTPFELPGRPRRAVVFSFRGDNVRRARIVPAVDGFEVITAPSAAVLATLPARARAGVYVIPNAVRPARLATRATRAATRAAWSVPADAPLVGYVGRFSPEKGVLVAAAAAAQLPAPWHAVFVGAGHLEPQVRAAMGPRARIVPWADDVGAVYGALDALMLPSVSEGCSNALLEAWAAGVPVVATRTGSVVDHPTAVRVPDDRGPAALAAAVLADAADPAGTAARVAAARRLAATDFAPQRFAARWLMLIAHAAVKDRRTRIVLP